MTHFMTSLSSRREFVHGATVQSRRAVPVEAQAGRIVHRFPAASVTLLQLLVG